MQAEAGRVASAAVAEKKVLVGVCAMEKKARSKQMMEILTRLEEFPAIQTLVMSQQTILEEPIASWPVFDCLISFHSDGFPLKKAQEYAAAVKPFMINDLDMQEVLWDRRQVYTILKKYGVPVPRYSTDNAKNIKEFEDYIIVNGKEIHKPFVEKPVSAEDHNVYIYFPSNAGGGSQRLFRKTGDKSSFYSPDSKIRRVGDYIYEEFMPTDGTDVKVYLVGPHYAHAEARKSPGLDGKVYRDAEGKEQRYPVILTPIEKLIARRIYFGFKQTVCGFDLLRTNDRSYVCDVNGFSFVKNSKRYYDDAAKILAQMIARQFQLIIRYPRQLEAPLSARQLLPPKNVSSHELRCVIAVIRHGDRTPKQKIKMTVNDPAFMALYAKFGGALKADIQMKSPNELQEVLDVVKNILRSGKVGNTREKLQQIRFVLEMKGRFSGINRKVELKASKEASTDGERQLDLVVKWGGELTKTGRQQAEVLGQCFRQLYPVGRGCPSDSADPQTMGLLRLHATFRHHLKIYASDEGRVQMTAAAFAKGFLALEGELPPILAHMVKSANTNGLLGHRSEIHQVQKSVKSRLFDLLNADRELTADDETELNPCQSLSVAEAIRKVGNPHAFSAEIALLLKGVVDHIDAKRKSPPLVPLYAGETWDFLSRRWRKLLKDFERSPGQFDLSKIPDIYDGIRYDRLHNSDAINFSDAPTLYSNAQAMANIITPQENGLRAEEKLKIGGTICNPLLDKIHTDLERNFAEEVLYQLDAENSNGISTPERLVRTRLYFTSESHIHGLLQVLLHGSPWKAQGQWQQAQAMCSGIAELNYLSQIVIMLYEDASQSADAEERFRVQIHFSPGVVTEFSSTDPEQLDAASSGTIISPLITLHDALSYSQMSSFLKKTVKG